MSTGRAACWFDAGQRSGSSGSSFARAIWTPSKRSSARISAAVYGWILRIVRNVPAAEDLTVETFWRIYQARARFEAARGFDPWARALPRTRRSTGSVFAGPKAN